MRLRSKWLEPISTQNQYSLNTLFLESVRVPLKEAVSIAITLHACLVIRAQRKCWRSSQRRHNNGVNTTLNSSHQWRVYTVYTVYIYICGIRGVYGIYSIDVIYGIHSIYGIYCINSMYDVYGTYVIYGIYRIYSYTDILIYGIYWYNYNVNSYTSCS